MLGRTVALVGALLLAGCGGGGTTTPSPEAAAPDNASLSATKESTGGEPTQRATKRRDAEVEPSGTEAPAEAEPSEAEGPAETAPTPSPTLSLTPDPSPEPTPQYRYYPVTEVVDGDTVKVARKGETTIRIIGIDTPETVDPNSPVECGGPTASALAEQLLGGEEVRLVFDSSQGRKDYYDRTLAYVVTRGGTDFGLEMIQRGAAAEYTYDTAYARQGRYQAAEQQAQAADRGLWGNCGGPHAAPETTPPPEPTQAPGSGGGGGGGGCAEGYSPCVPPYPPDVNCDDVDGPITVTGPDPHGLDADDDGVACET